MLYNGKFQFKSCLLVSSQHLCKSFLTDVSLFFSSRFFLKGTKTSPVFVKQNEDVSLSSAQFGCPHILLPLPTLQHTQVLP